MSPQKINIGVDKKDPFYRYKRPMIEARVEKGGTNGVKTVIKNMREIAVALNVSPEYPTKFFGYELGSQASYTVSSDRTCAIVKGAHTVESLERILEEFIRIFVLCPKCDLPEIRLSAIKGKVRLQCNACGCACGLLKSHRLENFILKNPPKVKNKITQKLKTSMDIKLAEEIADQEEWSSDSSPKTKKEKAKEPKKEKTKESVSGKGKQKETEKFLEEPPKLDLILRNFVKEGASTVATASELNRLQLAYSLSVEERNRVLLLALIDSPKSCGAQFEKYAELLKIFVNDKTSAILMIGSIEQFLSNFNLKDKDKDKDKEKKESTNMLDRMPVILEKLYHANVLGEEFIMDWWNSPPAASSWAVSIENASLARKCAHPFIEWLQTAEEE